MKRIAWLLLAISLPAWATINGVDSSRVVLPSFDGARYGMYADGALPASPSGLIYVNNVDDNPPTTKNPAYGSLGFIEDQSDIVFDPTSIGPDGVKCGSAARVYDGPDIFVVTESGNKVLRYDIDASATGYNTECSDTLRHRTFLRFGMNLQNDKTGAHTTGGNGFRIIPDIEYWIGFRFKVNCTGNLPANPFFFAPGSSQPAEPEIQLAKECDALLIRPERHRDENGDTIDGPSTTVSVTHNAWHCVVVRWIKKPYSRGTPGSYDPAHVGGTPAGTFETWIDGVIAPGSKNATNGYGYTGTDHEAWGRYNSVLRLGAYWGTQTNSSTADLYFDDIMIAEGAGKSASVTPEGCAEITP